MPKDISGSVPISKSQRNKNKRKKNSAPVVGGICSRCDQVSTSATPGTAHMGCERDNTSDLMQQLLRYQHAKNFSLDVFGRDILALRDVLSEDGRGKWLTKEAHGEFASAVREFLTGLKNFNSKTLQWEDITSEPIDFKTGEPLPAMFKAA